MRLTSLLVGFAVAAAIATVPAQAGTITVHPAGTGDQPTIQAAITAAVDGDVVLLADGIYLGAGNRGINFLGKAITVRSEHGPGSTVIDCENQDRGFRFINGETSAAVLEGVTIRNAVSVNEGGGLFIQNASPQIRDCVVSGCDTDGNGGGGAFVVRNLTVTAPNFENCEFLDNNGGSLDGDGGAVRIDGATPTFTGCIFAGNTAHRGAAIFAKGGLNGVTVTDSEFRMNAATIDGGAVWIQQSTGGTEITGNVFYGNQALHGGALGFYNAAGVRLTSNTIAENMASAGGAGIALTGASSAVIDRTIIAWNSGSHGLSAGSAAVSGDCVIVGANPDGDIEGAGVGFTNLSDQDPGFCGTPGSRYYYLQSDSPGAPSVAACGQLIGAYGVQCQTTATEQTTWSAVRSIFD